MAGSYRHIVNGKNEFIGTDLLDNFGDVHEALEELYDMVQHLSGGDIRKIHEAWREGHVGKRMRHRLGEEPELFEFDSWWPDDQDE